MTPLEIEILITKAGQGDTQAIEGLKNLHGTQEKATEGTRAMAKEGGLLNEVQEEFGRRGGAAHEAFEGIERASRGGEAGLFGLAKTWRALTEAMALNPFTAVLIALAALGPVLVEIGKKLFDVGESTKEMAEKHKAAMEEVKKHNDEVDKASLENYRAELKATADAAKELNEQLLQVVKNNALIDEARDKADRALIKNDPALNAEEKAAKLAVLDAAATHRKRDEEITAQAAPVAGDLAQFTAANDAAIAARADLAREKAQYQALLDKGNILARQQALAAPGIAANQTTLMGQLFTSDTEGAAATEATLKRQHAQMELLANQAEQVKKLEDLSRSAIEQAQKIAEAADKNVQGTQGKLVKDAVTADDNIRRIGAVGAYQDVENRSDAGAAIRKAEREDTQSAAKPIEEAMKLFLEFLKTDPRGKANAEADPKLAGAAESLEKLAGKTASEGSAADQAALLHRMMDFMEEIAKDKIPTQTILSLGQRLDAVRREQNQMAQQLQSLMGGG